MVSCYLLGRPKGRRTAGILVAALLIAAGAVIGAQTAGVAGARPDAWARPVASTALGNLYKVDDGLYRSRQPDRKGFEEARKMGIRTVVDLRSEHSDEKLAEGLGLNLVRVPMHAWHFSEDQIVRALRAIQAGPKPVLVHCQRGSDRAGVVAAAYRVVVQGWTKGEAIAELKHGGFGFHGYYLNIPAFIRHMDPDKLRALLASPEPHTGPGPGRHLGQ
jgi:protein tyrosine phosphatase (PTP) superfamily phosphohydrolase (DUF442 family)